MSTLDRLRALVRGTGNRPTQAAAHAPSAPLRELTYEPVDEDGQPFPVHDSVLSLEGAALVDGPLGPALVVDRVFEAGEWYGRLRVREAMVTPDDVALLSGASCSPSDRRDGRRSGDSDGPVLFLDLETTGLSGGAGTVAFLVGCGRFVDGAFVTRQFLLPGFAAERVLLAAVAAYADAAGAMVTYNGKSFDVPVMETRWAFHRMPSPWDDLVHLDMLHLARRLWRGRIDGLGETGCRLVTLERDLFDVERVGDVPGWEIPARYFEFIRRGDPAVLAPVLHHNRLDLLSLACVTARAARLLQQGRDAAADPEEVAAIGREWLRRGDEAGAEACFRHALVELPPGSPLRPEALYGLARLLRRQRRHAEAAPLWLELARSPLARAALRREATEALAIHYEHRARDLQSAHRWVERARALPLGSRRREQLEHRRARLERKLAARPAPGVELPTLPLEG